MRALSGPIALRRLYQSGLPVRLDEIALRQRRSQRPASLAATELEQHELELYLQLLERVDLFVPGLSGQGGDLGYQYFRFPAGVGGADEWSESLLPGPLFQSQ